MNENELCKLIIENMNGITCNRWYTMIINTKDKKAVFEVMHPTKGNIKVRKPIGYNKYNDTYNYIVYRITNKNTLFNMGIYTNGRSTDTEIIKIDYEGLETV